MRSRREAAGPLVIVIVTLLVFRGYLTGATSPNWDFFGGYLTTAYSWWDLGGFFRPTRSLPYIFGGIPAYLSLQNSSWYLPVGLLANSVGFTASSAAALQAVTIGCGALGVLVLARRWGMSRLSATTAGIAYLFVPGTISNAQHVDIVRAWGFFPWLLLVLSVPRKVTWWSYVLTVGLWFQFFVGAYPGNLISAAYLCAFWGLGLLAMGRGTDAGRHLWWWAATILPGVLMSGLKWIPYLTAESTAVNDNQIVFSRGLLATLFFPFQDAQIPNDVTMRTFFVVPVLVLAAFFAPVKDWLARQALALLTIGALLGIDTPIGTGWQEHLPLLGLSRFRTTDFKIGIILGLILLGALGIDRLRRECGRQGVSSDLRWSRPVGMATVLALGITALAVSAGLGRTDLLTGLAWLISGAMLLSVLVWAGHWPVDRGLRLIMRRATAALVVVGTAVIGWTWALTFQVGWNIPREQSERAAYGGFSVSELLANQLPQELTARPARSAPTFPDSPGAPLLNSQSWNSAEISRMPSLAGYVNLKGQPRAEQIAALAVDPEGVATMELLAAPSAGWVAADLPGGSAKKTTACLRSSDCTVRGSRVTPRRWSADGIRFAVNTPSPGTVVVNEVSWPGWVATVCPAAGHCTRQGVPHDPARLLASAAVPSGASTVTFQVRTPHAWAAWRLFWLAAATALLITAWLALSGFRVRRVASPESTT